MKSIADIKHAFYINLTKRTDRKKHVEEQLSSVGIVGERFNAVEISNGAIGCSLSHLKCLKNAFDNDLPHVLICEDDITFLEPEVFINQVNKFLESHCDDNSWDVLLLAGNNVPPYKLVDDTCVKVKHCQTTTGYIVKKHYYKKLMTNIQEGINLFIKNPQLGFSYAIDKYWISLQKRDNWFLITPLTVVQKDNYSDIEKKVTNYSKLMLDLDKPHLQKK
uniref:Glycosyl transferase family 25 domain-containing protein n=1 Tax=viral metagenome TaxID=1070528 RepID=A0A6C0F2U3_9ZZZZ